METEDRMLPSRTFVQRFLEPEEEKFAIVIVFVSCFIHTRQNGAKETTKKREKRLWDRTSNSGSHLFNTGYVSH